MSSSLDPAMPSLLIRPNKQTKVVPKKSHSSVVAPSQATTPSNAAVKRKLDEEPTTTDASFTRLANLACGSFGSKVIFATDEWFAVGANLVTKGDPIHKPQTFTENGAWMDGWESRRKRTSGHDWCLIKLGLPGVVVGVDIDTSYFTGNYPPFVSIQGACIDESLTFPGRKDPECITEGLMGSQASAEDLNLVEELHSEQWTELVPMSKMEPSSHNYRHVQSDQRFTHIRVNMFPDGGIARLRVYGHVDKDWSQIPRDEVVDMAAAMNGGTAVSWSDAHYGKPSNLIGPGRGVNMGDGWETARKSTRGPILQEGTNGLIDYGGQCDWAMIKLAAPCDVREVEIDTLHFKGNFPESCVVEACSHTGPTQHPTPENDEEWQSLLPRVKLGPHQQHVFQDQVNQLKHVTHVRVTIYPDGGISRLRVRGVRA